MTDYSRFLVITHESVGERMAGPGIRYWEIARALGAHGVQVTLASPWPSTRQASNVEVCEFSWEDSQSLLGLISRNDVVLANGPVFARVINILGKPLDKPSIVDVYYSPEIERVMLNLSHQRSATVPLVSVLDELYAYLHQGDLFLCATERQVDFWLGALMAVGRLNEDTLRNADSLDSLIKLVPLGLPENPPSKDSHVLKGVVPGIGVNDKVIFWGGGIWDWTDPFSLLDALKITLKSRRDVRVVFAALHHYEKKIVPEMSVAGRLVEDIHRQDWLGKHVFFLDWIPYDARGAYLSDADVGVSLAFPTLESRYAVRIRLMDYLWAGLPCVINVGDDTARILKEAKLAKFVVPGDSQGVSDALMSVLSDGKARERIAQEAYPIIQQYSWLNVVKPILAFLRQPQLAADGLQSRQVFKYQLPLRKDWESLRFERLSLNEKIDSFRKRRAVRLADALAKLFKRRR